MDVIALSPEDIRPDKTPAVRLLSRRSFLMGNNNNNRNNYTSSSGGFVNNKKTWQREQWPRGPADTDGTTDCIYFTPSSSLAHSESEKILERMKKDHVILTSSDENHRRRTIIVSKQQAAPASSYGFTLQTYAIKRSAHPLESSGRASNPQLRACAADVMRGDGQLPRHSDPGGLVNGRGSPHGQHTQLLTYIDYVDYNGPAYLAGMRAGDVILSINGHNMEYADHNYIVQYIKRCKRPLRMVVMFENCVKKVELHVRCLKLKQVLADKMLEFRSLCRQEQELVQKCGKVPCDVTISVEPAAAPDDEPQRAADTAEDSSELSEVLDTITADIFPSTIRCSLLHRDLAAAPHLLHLPASSASSAPPPHLLRSASSLSSASSTLSSISSNTASTSSLGHPRSSAPRVPTGLLHSLLNNQRTVFESPPPRFSYSFNSAGKKTSPAAARMKSQSTFYLNLDEPPSEAEHGEEESCKAAALTSRDDSVLTPSNNNNSCNITTATPSLSPSGKPAGTTWSSKTALGKSQSWVATRKDSWEYDSRQLHINDVDEVTRL